MTHRRTPTACFILLALAACKPLPPEAYRNHGDPEQLIVRSADLVTIDLSDKDYNERLGDALAGNAPDKAILYCLPTSSACKKAKVALAKHHVPTEVSTDSHSVTLVYDRIEARDCNQSYSDNSINHYNLNHEAFGCSMTANTVQMVTDKHQFTNPDLMDFRDGEKTESVYENYLNPPPENTSSGSGSGSGSLIPSSSGGGGQ